MQMGQAKLRDLPAREISGELRAGRIRSRQLAGRSARVNGQSVRGNTGTIARRDWPVGGKDSGQSQSYFGNSEAFSAHKNSGHNARSTCHSCGANRAGENKANRKV